MQSCAVYKKIQGHLVMIMVFALFWHTASLRIRKCIKSVGIKVSLQIVERWKLEASS